MGLEGPSEPCEVRTREIPVVNYLQWIKDPTQGGKQSFTKLSMQNVYLEKYQTDQEIESMLAATSSTPGDVFEGAWTRSSCQRCRLTVKGDKAFLQDWRAEFDSFDFVIQVSRESDLLHLTLGDYLECKYRRDKDRLILVSEIIPGCPDDLVRVGSQQL
jgi:hypothetical protein